MSSSEAGQVIGWILVLALALWFFYFFQKPITLFVRTILTGALAVPYMVPIYRGYSCARLYRLASDGTSDTMKTLKPRGTINRHCVRVNAGSLRRFTPPTF